MCGMSLKYPLDKGMSLKYPLALSLNRLCPQIGTAAGRICMHQRFCRSPCPRALTPASPPLPPQGHAGRARRRSPAGCYSARGSSKCVITRIAASPCIHMYIHTHIHTYTHTYIHTYIHTHTHTLSLSLSHIYKHIHIYICIHIYIHVLNKTVQPYSAC
jgi:hypothetical protein